MLNVAQLARVDINLLLVFDLLVEERSASRAAQRLNLTPSAISHALKRLRALFDDPLFLSSPKGMVPTDFALRLAPAVRDIVERVQGVLASARSFDPTTSERKFRVGAPDAATYVILPPLVSRLEKVAPGVDLSFVQLLPRPGSTDPREAWSDALAELDGSRISIAVLPHAALEQRFYSSALYEEDFVVVTRRGHPFAKAPSLEAFAAARHLLVSASGESWGVVDQALERQCLKRRIALTVPSFLMAIPAIEFSDLVAALPRHFAEHAARDHDLVVVEPPIDLFSSQLHAVLPHGALLDQGLSWLLRQIEEVSHEL